MQPGPPFRSSAPPGSTDTDPFGSEYRSEQCGFTVIRNPRKRAIQADYDAMAERYHSWSGAVEGDPRDRFVEALAARLPRGDRVVDLERGAGIPSTKQLAEP